MTFNLTEVSKTLIGGLTLAAVIAAPAACTMHEDRMIAQMVKNGADPFAARCSVRAGGTNACLIVAARSHQK